MHYLFLFLVIVLTQISQFACLPVNEIIINNPKLLPGGQVLILRTNYHGWSNSVIMSNGKIEVIVVPEINRIMVFRFCGGENVFWENMKLLGQKADSEAKDWINFGGDKSWPAPQSAWISITGRGWPPPKGFDSMPATLEIRKDYVQLISAIDPSYGIRVIRTISLNKSKPVMIVDTVYEKLWGEPLDVSVWVITQMRDPVGVFIPVSEKMALSTNLLFVKLTDELPSNFCITNGLLSLTRNQKTGCKIGVNSESMIWMDDKYVLKIEFSRKKNAEYPDHGSNIEVWTNPDPYPYIELETLGPIVKLKKGEKVKATNTYILSRRSSFIALQDAQRVRD